MKVKLAVAVLAGLAAASFAAAQEKGDVFYKTAGPAVPGVAGRVSLTPVLGAPYTATVTDASVQVLADGNRIARSTTGTVARDAQGRTRQDAPLPTIGNMAAANAPHFVFINDPVGQKNYTLNLTEKTAHSFSMPGPGNGELAAMKMKLDAESHALPPPGQEVFVQRQLTAMDKMKAETLGEATEVKTEDLGSQTMEGVLVTGTRTTKTIAAGQIGNEKPIVIVTEVWTSPELKTVVMSKRSDPRIGEQTFQLTNIVRAEPDPSLFTVPADFKVIEQPQPVIYQMKQ